MDRIRLTVNRDVRRASERLATALIAAIVTVGAQALASAPAAADEPRSQLHIPPAQPSRTAQPPATASSVKTQEPGKTAPPAVDAKAARAALPPPYAPQPPGEMGRQPEPTPIGENSAGRPSNGGARPVDNPVSSLQPVTSMTQPIARLAFGPGASALSEDSIRELDAVAVRMTRETGRRLQVVAYAHTATNESDARRLSLTRAIAVRSHLLERGIARNRIDVRALGDRAPGDPKDRVDLLFSDP